MPAHQANIDHEVCDAIQNHDMDTVVFGREILNAFVGGMSYKEQFIKGFHRFKFFNGLVEHSEIGTGFHPDIRTWCSVRLRGGLPLIPRNSAEAGLPRAC